MIHIGWPQGIILLLMVLAFVQSRNWPFTMVNNTIWLVLLWWGGFFGAQS